MKKIKFVNDQEPNISAETLNELQDNVEAGVIEEAEKATDEALTRKVVPYRNVLVDEQALIKECGGSKLKSLNKIVGREVEQETREGYNLLDYTKIATTGFKPEIEYSEDGFITFNNTSNSQNSYIIFPIDTSLVKANTDYLLKVEQLEASGYSKAQTYLQKNNDDYSKFVGVYNGTVINRTTDTFLQVLINQNYGTKVKIRLTLVEGTIAKEWEAYGKTPTPDNPSEIKTVTGDVEVNVGNKNLAKISDTARLKQNEDNIELLAKYDGTKLTDISLETGEYTISLVLLGKPTTATSFSNYLDDVHKNENGFANIQNFELNKKYTKKITLTKTTQLKYAIWGNTNADLFKFQFQIEKGTEATDYTPHQSQVKTISLGDIELCKIGDYADYIYKADGKWFKRSNVGKKIYNDSNAIQLQNNDSYGNITYGGLLKPTNATFYNKYDSTSDYFINTATVMKIGGGELPINSTERIDTIAANPDTHYLWVGFPKGTTLEEIREKLVNSVLYYQLATPTDTEILNARLIAQLSALEHIQLYEGITNITITGDNLTPIADIDYWTWFKGESGEPAEETKYKMKDDFAVITGNSEIEAETATNIEIVYPDGYTEENCVLISCGIKAGTNGYNYVGKFDDSMDLYYNAVKRTLTLSTDKIILRIDNKNTTKTTYYYKVVLMKI